MIIKTLIKSKSNNPVILLDEIEKLGRSYRGDPANALLEILDPSQNTSFVDHYVSLPIDLSKVMFICTANDVDELSLPLRNRLELISISGYTSEEKFDIATKNIIPEQKKQNGVADLISFKDDAVNEIIKYSTEMGVRQLERDVAKICRKVAYKGKKEEIDVKRVNDILGKRKE
jgi:ATP-dependent Lon protease